VYNNGASLPRDYVSIYGIDVNKGSTQRLNFSPAPPLPAFNFSNINSNFESSHAKVIGGEANLYAKKVITYEETPQEITQLYAIISKMQSTEGSEYERKMRLRAIVEELIRDYESNDQLSREATINICRVFIEKY